MSDLNQVVIEPQVLLIADKSLEVRPITLGMLPAFTRAARALWPYLQMDEPDYMNMIIDGGEQVIDALALALREDPAWVRELDLAQAADALEAVIEVNVDFFIQTLLPKLKAMQARGGPWSASGLSGMDTIKEPSSATV